jgi:hypothetical protein
MHRSFLRQATLHDRRPACCTLLWCLVSSSAPRRKTLAGVAASGKEIAAFVGGRGVVGGGDWTGRVSTCSWNAELRVVFESLGHVDDVLCAVENVMGEVGAELAVERQTRVVWMWYYAECGSFSLLPALSLHLLQHRM